MNQRGFSLLEAVIVAAIVATVAAFFFTSPLSSQPAAAHAAVAQFDAALAYARAYASAHGSATLAFTAQNGRVTVTVQGAPPFVIDASVRDKTAGPPPFAIVLDGAGHASGAGCPAGGWALTFRAGTRQADESLACLP